ncbi:MAG: Ig family protein [Limisphaerales bacterium]|nr:MAG: Ig family protein [Limisphaerales bacterium]KAG0508176.1 MAG: Ig family protein [Limisphaerales bacterium]TXT51412.1 MAG: Ig family protein [Limisphaerales bacterium]
MKRSLFSPGFAALAGLGLVLAGPAARAADVAQFNLLKGQTFLQTGTGAPVASSPSNFVMQSEGNAQVMGALTNMTFTKPSAQVVSLSADGDGGFRFEQAFSSMADLNTAFPGGTYTVTMQTVSDGTRAVALLLDGDLYPDTPHISNFTAAQAVVPSQDFTLTWDTWFSGTAQDIIQVRIVDGGNQDVFSSPEQGQPGALTGLSTAFLIPARKLRPGQTYGVEVVFGRSSDFNQSSYPGATGLAAYFKRLQFQLVTTGTPTGPTAGEFELVFNFFPGTFDGTNGSVSFPQYLGYYFALYNIDNDTNYPASVTFTGPGGSGLTNVPSQVNGSSFGSSAFYSSPAVFFSPGNLPQGAIYSPTQPSGGIYTVGYKTSNYMFNLLDPLAADQQILVVPTVVLSATNTIQEIRWTYKTTNGATVGPQAFMENIEIRVNGTSGGRLYDGGNDYNSRILPAVTNHTPTASVPWTNVSSIQMLFVDTVGNQYVSYWDRATQPVEITTTGLPNATQGTPYSFLLSSQGGTQPVSWSLLSGFLPSGLFLSAGTGEILGTPGENGSFPLTFQARDTAQAVTNRALTLFVAAGSFPAPVLTNAARLGNGQLKVVLGAVSNQTYTLESSTNLINWVPRVTLLATNAQMDLIDPDALAMFPRLFYRMRIGRTFGTAFNFHFYAPGGNFGAGLTPTPGFPVALNSYSANFDTENARSNPPPASVLFTGPNGSSLSSGPADAQNSNLGYGEARFQSAVVFNPVVPPGGAWTVNYHGSNLTFTVPAPQAASRLVIPVPTATLTGGNLTSVSWVYKDATTGATLGQPPGHLTGVQVQVDVQGQGRVYNSENVPPGTTSVGGISGVVWNDVVNLFMVYDDSLGNHYVVNFNRP